LCSYLENSILVAAAVIQWLNGEAKAYTNQSGNIEVDATNWSNGNVVMSGASYNGTIPIAVAAAGIEGLKAAIPIAAIASWYDYYRKTGTVVYPGRNNDWHPGFMGEDADDLAILCFSRSMTALTGIPSSVNYRANNAEGIRLREAYAMAMKDILDGMDNVSGNYNRWWDDRNYLATADQITAGIIIQHGFGDFNVKTTHFDKFYKAVKDNSDASVKLVLNRGGHGSVSTHQVFFHLGHQFLDHYLWGIENDYVDGTKDVYIADSNTGSYDAFDTWPIAGSEYTRYYLNPESGVGEAGTLSLEVPVSKEYKIKDSQLNQIVHTTNNTNRPWPVAESIAATQRQYPTAPEIDTWERRMYNIGNIGAPSTERIAFVTDITENVRVNGTVVASIELSSDVPWGNVTAALVEIGNGRSFGTSNVETIPAANGVASIALARYNAPGTASGNNFWTTYRLVTSGHAGIQNPNETDIVTPEEFPHLPGPRGRTFLEAADTNYVPAYYFQSIIPEAGENHVYTFEFETYDWEFRAGNKMAIIVYSTDYRYTLRPTNPPELTVVSGPNTFIDIPALSQFNTTVPDHMPHAVALLDELDVKFEIPFNVNAAGEKANLEAQLAEIFAANRIYLQPVVQNIGGEFFLIDPDPLELRGGDHYLLTVFRPVPNAFVTKLNGNKNDLTIWVNHVYTNGSLIEAASAKFSIDNNAEGTYTVGRYSVFVDTKGNTQVRDLRIVGAVEAPPAPPPVEEVVLVRVSTNAKDVKIAGSNVWTVSFKVTETFSNGDVNVVDYSVQINKNSSGKANLGAYTLIYDIAGNGSNIKDFRVVLN